MQRAQVPPESGGPAGVAEDRRLVLAAAAGDEEAFGSLVLKYGRVVRALVRARLGAGADADDAVQETFVVAWRKLASLDAPDRFAGWISRIAVNKALERIRRTGRRRSMSLDALPAEPGVEPGEDPVARREEVERMLDLVGTLDEKTQRVLTLRFLHGMAVKDVATQVGDQPPATAMRISRALRRLRALMEPEGEDR